MAGIRYGTRDAGGSPFLKFMTAVNVAMAAAIVAIWPVYGQTLADPMAAISGGGPESHPSVFQYPYLLLWVIPLVAIGGTYVAKSMELPPLARFFAVFPMALAATCGGWLYFYAGFWN